MRIINLVIVVCIFCSINAFTFCKNTNNKVNSLNESQENQQITKTFKIIDYDLWSTNKDLRGFEAFSVEQIPAIYIKGYAEIGYSEISLRLSKKLDDNLDNYKEIETKAFKLEKKMFLTIPFNRLESGHYKIELLFLGRVRETALFEVSNTFGHVD